MKDSGGIPIATSAAASPARGGFDLRQFSGDAALVMVGAAVGNAFSYIFHFVLSRKLGPDAYGTLVSLMALASMLAVVGNSLSTVAMQETARLWATHDDRLIAPFVRRAARFAFGIALASGLFVVVTSLLLGPYLHVTQPVLWLLLSVFIALQLLAAFARGSAQGAHRFLIFGLSFVAEGAVKVALGVVFVVLGYGVAGAMGGLIGSAIVVLAVALPAVMSKGTAGKFDRAQQLQLGRSVMFVLGVTAAVNALLFMDMLFAKHHLSGSDAGYFGAAGTIARTIPFAGSFIALILMPKAAAAWHVSRESLARVLLLTAAMTAACVIGGLIVVNVFASQIVGITYGKAFMGAVPLLRAYSVDEALLAVWAAANAYLVAVARYDVLFFLVLAVVIEASVMAVIGSTPLRLLSTAIAINALLAPAAWALAWRTLATLPQAGRPLPAENLP